MIFLETSAFYGASNLKIVNLPDVTELKYNQIFRLTGIEEICMPSLTSMVDCTYCFYSSDLFVASFPSLTADGLGSDFTSNQFGYTQLIYGGEFYVDCDITDGTSFEDVCMGVANCANIDESCGLDQGSQYFHVYEYDGTVIGEFNTASGLTLDECKTSCGDGSWEGCVGFSRHKGDVGENDDEVGTCYWVTDSSQFVCNDPDDNENLFILGEDNYCDDLSCTCAGVAANRGILDYRLGCEQITASLFQVRYLNHFLLYRHDFVMESCVNLR